jgi:hypothetical protein
MKNLTILRAGGTLAADWDLSDLLIPTSKRVSRVHGLKRNYIGVQTTGTQRHGSSRVVIRIEPCPTENRCLQILEPGTLLSDLEIPMWMEMCHCNSCRRATGSLGASFPPLKSSPSPDTLSKLIAYNSSQVLTRYFCSTCGCHCFLYNHQCERWYCLSGTVEPSAAFRASNNAWPKDTVKVSRHDNVLDTLDGGLAPLLLNLNGRSIPTWSATPQQPPNQHSFDLPYATILSLPSKSVTTPLGPDDGAYLTAKCHCGGVSLLIKRANYTFDSDSSSNSNPEASARYVTSDFTKYLTYLCACRSCRLSTGVPLVPWTLIPPANIFNANSSTTIGDSSSTPFDDRLVPVIFGHATSSPNANSGLALKHHWS